MQCLFTGEFEARAKVEHAIPCALGGRIRTRESTCSDFNEKSAAAIDEPLVLQWRMVTVLLAPAMSREHRSAASLPLRAAGVDSAFNFVPGAGLSRTKFTVLRRDERGRPAVYAGPPEEVIKRAKDWSGDADPRVLLELPPIQKDTVFELDQVPTSPETEVAALKAVLVALDTVPGAPRDFVRSEEAVLARALVGEAVRTKTIPPDLYIRVMHGHDPSLLTGARDLARKLQPDLGPLDHIIIVSGCHARRVVVATWSIFGHDPVSMYLSRDYRRDGFTTVFISPPTEGRAISVHRPSCDPWTLPRTAGLRTLTLSEAEQRLDLLPALMKGRGDAAAHAWVHGALANTGRRPEILYNHCVYLRNQGRTPPTVGDLLQTIVAEEYGRGAVDVSADLAELLESYVPASLRAERIFIPQQVRVGDHPGWVIPAATAYLGLIKALYARVGPPIRFRYPTLPSARAERRPLGP